MPNLVVKSLFDILTIKLGSLKYKETNKLYFIYVMKRLRMETSKLYYNGELYDHLITTVYTLIKMERNFEELKKVPKPFFSYGIDNDNDNAIIHLVIHDSTESSITIAVELYDPYRRIKVKRVYINEEEVVSNHTIFSDQDQSAIDKELDIMIRESLIEYIHYIIEHL